MPQLIRRRGFIIIPMLLDNLFQPHTHTDTIFQVVDSECYRRIYRRDWLGKREFKVLEVIF